MSCRSAPRRDLADVVQERAAADDQKLVLGKSHPTGNGLGVAHHPLGVIARLVLARVERRHQGEKCGAIGCLDIAERRLQLLRLVLDVLLQPLLVAPLRQCHPPLGESALNGPHELGDLGRLEQIVVRAAPQAVHGRLGVAVAGQHDDGDVLIRLADAVEKPQTVVVGHLQVADHQLEALRHERQRCARVRGAGAGIALLGQQNGQDLADGHVVVHDEDVRRFQMIRRADGRTLHCCLQKEPREGEASLLHCVRRSLAPRPVARLPNPVATHRTPVTAPSANLPRRPATWRGRGIRPVSSSGRSWPRRGSSGRDRCPPR